MEFCNAYNEATKDKRGQLLPAEVTIFEDRSFTFVVKLPPVSEIIKQTLKIKSGSGETPKKVVGTLTADQVREIAETKMTDLNTTNIDAAIKTISGTAKSMGVKVA